MPVYSGAQRSQFLLILRSFLDLEESCEAFGRNFFLDPTHVRPVHPETLKFAMESVEFRNVGLRFSSPMSERRIPPLKLNGDTPELEDFNRAIAELNELIYGYMEI